MKFSVLMSIYKNDAPNFLVEALDSLCKQTLLADDVVIVRDGPVPSNIQSVIDRYSNLLPIQYVTLDDNVGLGNALNIGLRHVKHDWVFRMDSDDISVPNRFELQVLAISECPNLGVVGGWIEEFSESPGDTQSYRKVPISNNSIRNGLRSYSAFNHVTVAFNKNSVVESGSYIGGTGFQEDYYLWLRMAVKEVEFLNLPNVLVHVRAGDDMLGRRCGFSYFKNECIVAFYGLKNGIIPIHIFISNIIVKFFARMSPLFVRRIVYKAARMYINK